jgi:hypothetical protein
VARGTYLHCPCVVWTLAVFKALLLRRAFLVCFVTKILLPAAHASVCPDFFLLPCMTDSWTLQLIVGIRVSPWSS